MPVRDPAFSHGGPAFQQNGPCRQAIEYRIPFSRRSWDAGNATLLHAGRALAVELDRYGLVCRKAGRQKRGIR